MLSWLMDRMVGPPPRVPLSILTGFLGSGKTTVLNHLLAQPGMSNTAVIINEFGEIGLDHLLVEHRDEQMVMLANGCVCCTVRGDLLDTLRDLFERRRRSQIPAFKRLLIETTGLADPAPIVHALIGSSAVRSRVYLDTIATTVDAAAGLDTLATHAEARKQTAIADVVLITKRDLASAAQLAAIRERATELNPGAHYIDADHGAVDRVAVFGRRVLDPSSKRPDVRAWLAADAIDARTASDHTADIDSFCIARDTPITYAAVLGFLDALAGFRGPDLLRFKGIIELRESPDTPLVAHAVQHLMHPPRMLARWPHGPRRTELVFITRGISRADIECMLDGIERTTAVVTAPVLRHS